MPTPEHPKAPRGHGQAEIEQQKVYAEPPLDSKTSPDHEKHAERGQGHEAGMARIEGSVLVDIRAVPHGVVKNKGPRSLDEGPSQLEGEEVPKGGLEEEKRFPDGFLDFSPRIKDPRGEESDGAHRILDHITQKVGPNTAELKNNAVKGVD